MTTKSFVSGTIFWWPATIRGAIVVALSCLTVLYSSLEKMTSESVAAFGWIEWIKFLTPILIAGLITLKGFLDDTLQKLKDKFETGFLERPKPQ